MLLVLALAGCGGAMVNPCLSVACPPAQECFVRSGQGLCSVSCSMPGDGDPACAQNETCACHANAQCPQCKSCVLACAPK
jgi:hypothetical protein